MPYYRNLSQDHLLHEAVRNGDNAYVQMLVQQYGVDVNCVIGGDTALHYAALHGELKMMQSLLAMGAKVNVFNSTGCSPLMFSMWLGQQEAVDMLEQAGADTLAAKLVIAARDNNKKDIDLLSKEYTENINFAAAIPSHTAAMSLVLSSKWFDSPFDGNNGLESLMDSVCSHLHALGLAQAALIGVDEAAAEWIG